MYICFGGKERLPWLQPPMLPVSSATHPNGASEMSVTAKEELVAEMGAAFLCAIAGIANEHTDRNTTAYIQNWIEKLEEDTSRDEVRS